MLCAEVDTDKMAQSESFITTERKLWGDGRVQCSMHNFVEELMWLAELCLD